MSGAMEHTWWISMLLSFLILGISVGTAITVKGVAKAVQEESAKTQALLLEIRERLGK
jgi:hypothetical protein